MPCYSKPSQDTERAVQLDAQTGIVHQASAFHVSHVDPPNDCHVISVM